MRWLCAPECFHSIYLYPLDRRIYQIRLRLHFTLERIKSAVSTHYVGGAHLSVCKLFISIGYQIRLRLYIFTLECIKSVGVADNANQWVDCAHLSVFTVFIYIYWIAVTFQIRLILRTFTLECIKSVIAADESLFSLCAPESFYSQLNRRQISG